MDAIGKLTMLAGQMELEHAEDFRSERSVAQTKTENKPGCFTPKEQKAAFVHPAQLPNGKQIHLLKTLTGTNHSILIKLSQARKKV